MTDGPVSTHFFQNVKAKISNGTSAYVAGAVGLVLVIGAITVGGFSRAASPSASAPAPAVVPAPAPASNAAAAPVAKVGDRFGDWVFECAAVGAGETLCSLSQTLIATETKKPVARFTVSRNKKTSEIRFVAILPLGLDIAAGVTASVDGGAKLPLALSTCTPNGCIATTAVAPKLFDTMKAGKGVDVSFKFLASDKPINIVASMKGLKEGSEAGGI